MYDSKTWAENSTHGSIVAVPESVQNNSFVKWRQPQTKRVGIAIVVLAAVSLVCNVVWLALPYSSLLVQYRGAYMGMWGGVFLAVPGFVTLLTAMRPSKHRIAWVLLLALLGFVSAIAMLSISGLQLAIDPLRSSDPAAVMLYRSSMVFGVVFLVISVLSLALFLKITILSCQSLCCSTGMIIETPHYESSHYYPSTHMAQIPKEPYGPYGFKNAVPPGDAPPTYDEPFPEHLYPPYSPPSYSASVQQEQFPPK